MDGLPGIGFVLSASDELTGFDLDKCRDPKTCKLKPWVQDILAYGETYAEVSPSGRAEAGRKYFGLSRNGSYDAAARGEIPVIKIGRLKRVPVRALENDMLDRAGKAA